MSDVDNSENKDITYNTYIANNRNNKEIENIVDFNEFKDLLTKRESKQENFIIDNSLINLSLL